MSFLFYQDRQSSLECFLCIYVIKPGCQYLPRMLKRDNSMFYNYSTAFGIQQKQTNKNNSCKWQWDFTDWAITIMAGLKKSGNYITQAPSKRFCPAALQAGGERYITTHKCFCCNHINENVMFPLTPIESPKLLHYKCHCWL